MPSPSKKRKRVNNNNNNNNSNNFISDLIKIKNKFGDFHLVGSACIYAYYLFLGEPESCNITYPNDFDIVIESTEPVVILGILRKMNDIEFVDIMDKNQISPDTMKDGIKIKFGEIELDYIVNPSEKVEFTMYDLDKKEFIKSSDKLPLCNNMSKIIRLLSLGQLKRSYESEKSSNISNILNKKLDTIGKLKVIFGERDDKFNIDDYCDPEINLFRPGTPGTPGSPRTPKGGKRIIKKKLKKTRKRKLKISKRKTKRK